MPAKRGEPKGLATLGEKGLAENDSKGGSTTMTESIFNFIKNQYGKKVKITTSRNTFTGKLVRCDEIGNLSLLNERGWILIPRKFIVSVEILKEEMR